MIHNLAIILITLITQYECKFIALQDKYTDIHCTLFMSIPIRT